MAVMERMNCLLRRIRLYVNFLTGNIKHMKSARNNFRCSVVTYGNCRAGRPKKMQRLHGAFSRGKKGPCRTAILLNAGAGLYIGGASLTLAAGIKRARQLIDSGIALEKLEDFIVMSQNMGKIEKVKIATYQDDTDMV